MASAWSFLLIMSSNPVLGCGDLFWGPVLCPSLRNSDYLSMATMVWVNVSHPFLRRVVPTVTRVWCYRDRSCWNSGHHPLPQHERKYGPCHISGTVIVCGKHRTEARGRASRRLRSRPGLGRVVECARGQGTSESLLALEARARASHRLRSRPGHGRVASGARGQGSGESRFSLLVRTFLLNRGEVVVVDPEVFFCRFFLFN